MSSATVAVVAAQALVGAVFLVAGVGKTLLPVAARYSMMRPFLTSARTTLWAARLLPTAEIAVAVGVLAGWTPACVCSLAIAIALWFTVIVAYGRHRSLTCNCFGTRSRPLTRTTIVRNGAITALAAIGAVPSPEAGSARLPLMITVISVALTYATAAHVLTAPDPVRPHATGPGL